MILAILAHHYTPSELSIDLINVDFSDDQTSPDRIGAIKGLEELPAYTAYFFTDTFPTDPKVRDKVMGKGDPKARLAELIELAGTADFSSDTAIEEAIKALAAAKGLGFGDYQAVARLALSGTNVGPSITGMFRVLGRERVVGRLRRLANG
jgi:glutamyl-tRNA synthetase